jgi:hypothetical protein
MENQILDVIQTLAAGGETGRLQLQSGAMQGALFFRHGELVDARVGNLTGFPAVNAIAAMRNATFSFDPSVAPPALSSIRPSERVVLKQFFGIHPAEREEVPTVELPAVARYKPRSRFVYRTALIFAVLLVAIAVGAAALRNRYREQVLPATVGTNDTPATTPVAAEPVPATGAARRESAPAVDHNLTGKWTIVNKVQNTSFTSYKNLEIGFDLSIRQDGNGFTGEGRKVSENGRSLPANSQTPIHVKGSIEGDRIEAAFFEDGALRKTNGRFIWKMDKAGGLTGTFVSTAARASGKSTARKEL